jgi:predicted unusual protein kinase regulating ubiquinone biosynthesis (AarF/ABC1/UbiB family)
MEYFSTLPITDAGTLARRGVSAAEVLEIVVRAYARQVFVDGLFHADPHPGNLFVLDEPDVGRRPRVLFVDFGLSKRLEPELRTEMRSAIFAMLQGDLEAFLEGMGRLEMIEPGAEPGVREAVEAMFQRLRGEGVAPLGIAGDRVNDLLLYAKTVSYLFGLGAELAPEVDVMKLSVPYLLRFLASSPAGAPGGG